MLYIIKDSIVSCEINLDLHYLIKADAVLLNVTTYSDNLDLSIDILCKSFLHHPGIQ